MKRGIYEKVVEKEKWSENCTLIEAMFVDVKVLYYATKGITDLLWDLLLL